MYREGTDYSTDLWTTVTARVSSLTTLSDKVTAAYKPHSLCTYREYHTRGIRLIVVYSCVRGGFCSQS